LWKKFIDFKNVCFGSEAVILGGIQGKIIQ
jgi:hypothetical protein